MWKNRLDPGMKEWRKKKKLCLIYSNLHSGIRNNKRQDPFF